MKKVLKGKRVLLLLVNDVSYDQRVFRTSQTLQRAGAKVTIFGRELPTSREVNWGTISIQRFRIRPSSGPLMYWNMNAKYIKMASRERWDIVVSNDFDTLWAGYKIAKRNDAKWVFDAHEYFTEVPELTGKNIKRAIWHALGNMLIHRSDLAITVSKSIADIYTQTYSKDFSIIPNVPFKRSLSPEVKKESIILYQGALNKGRGLETAILAMHEIHDLELHLAGEGDLSDPLRKLVKKENLSDKVVFHGKLRPEPLKRLTESAWLGLNLLSDDSLNYYYSLANKFFDYAHAGIPSINMDFPEYHNLVKTYHNGLLLSTLEIAPYVSTIDFLRENERAYSLLRQGALRLAKVYNWEAQEDKLLELYTSMYT